MIEQPVPVHLAGVATEQPRGAYLFGIVMTFLLMLAAGVLVYMTMSAMERAWPDLPYLRTYGLLVINATAVPVLALITRWLHRMTLADLIAPGRRLDWGMMGRAALVYAVPVLVQVGIGLWQGELRLADTSLTAFLLLAPVSLLLFGLQASAEELVFRGYLAQGAQLLFRHAVPASVLTALLFMLVHEGAGPRAVWAQRAEIFCMALFLSWMTVRFGRLEAAMGVHIINNLLFSFFIGGSHLDFPDLTTRIDLDPPDPEGWAEWGGFVLHQVAGVGLFWLAGVKTGFIERGWAGRRSAPGQA